MIEFLQNYPPLTLTLTMIGGLVVGSFLNVVIYRLPLMFLRRWQMECQEWINLQSSSHPFIGPPKPFNLILPRSHCPHCHHHLSAWENIPVVSFFWLKGRCHHCSSPISKRYLVVELLTAFASVIVVSRFGVTLPAVGALFLTWILIALTFIDIEKQWLPDNLTLPALWLGLWLSLGHVFVTEADAIKGVIAGYLSLWSLYWIFKWVTKKEGMGYGDFKLFALLGAWLGWQSLLPIILIASSLGALIGLSLIWFGKRDRHAPIPFGPYLAVGGWMLLLWGDTFMLLLFS